MILTAENLKFFSVLRTESGLMTIQILTKGKNAAQELQGRKTSLFWLMQFLCIIQLTDGQSKALFSSRNINNLKNIF